MKRKAINTQQRSPARYSQTHAAVARPTDQRAAAIAQRKLIRLLYSSPPATTQRKLVTLINNSPRQLARKQANHTGMPDQLKRGIESLSGIDISDVRVQKNSDKPARLNALAYAQGNEIHLGRGQEQHLPHEAWHVVQQKQGRVEPTMQLAGAHINDNASLEKEADAMGAKAMQLDSRQQHTLHNCTNHSTVSQLHSPVIQRTIETAAQALYGEGIITVKNSMFKSKFNKAHGVTQKDLAKIQEALNALREKSSSGTDEAEKMLSDTQGDITDVKLEREGIEVYLDIDQLKHQPIEYPIGTRQTKAGNTFKPPTYGSETWHRNNTLVHMADWADSLGTMAEGQRVFHGQSTPVSGIHYEGYCLFAKGKKYVLFHCYPANKTAMKL